jgi:hypothetical protein
MQSKVKPGSHDNDIDPAVTEEVGGAGADDAAAEDHDAHCVSTDEQRNRRPVWQSTVDTKRISHNLRRSSLGCTPEICCTGPLPGVMGDRKEAYNV